MAPAFVQSKGGTSNAASPQNIVFTSNNTLGNLLVAGGRTNGGAVQPVITDTQGNTWVVVDFDNWTGVNNFWMAYAANCKAGANTVIVTEPGASCSTVIGEFSGVAITSPLDQHTHADTGAGTWTSASSGSVTPTTSGQLIVGFQ